MNLKEFRATFTTSLTKIYPKTEIDSFFFLLIEAYLQLQRIDYSLNPNFTINDETLAILQSALNRLEQEEPIQYIIGETEFYGLPFFVDKNTLIPRPETEELVAWILSDIDKKNAELSILDIGTGSGCIAISLAKNLPNAIITAIDFSESALKTAQKNAILNEVNINFKQQDILETKEFSKKYDIIVSNPPYVRELEKTEMQKNVLDNEPASALFVSNDNPLLFYKKIADLAQHHLNKNGVLYFEINQYLGEKMLAMLNQKKFSQNELRKDLFSNDRMTKSTI